MKTLCTILFLLVASATMANPLVLLSGSPPAAGGGGGDGFVGTSAAVVDAIDYDGTNHTWWSSFSASATGTVSYIYVRFYSGETVTYVRPAIWSADGSTLLASASDCTRTNTSTDTYRWTLSTPITVSIGTPYLLGYANGHPNLARQYTGTGSFYVDTGTAYTQNTCPGGTIRTGLSATSTSNVGTLPIWASNSTSEP